MAGKNWTPKEDEMLVQLFNDGKSNAQIAEFLPGRSVRSISIRLSIKDLTSKEKSVPRGDNNLVGMVSGKLTVVSQRGLSKTGTRLWLCKCDCGGEAIVPSYHLKRGNVRSCGCLKIGESNPAWKGHKLIGSAFWGGYERGAKNRGITFDLTIDQGWELYEKQQGKCFFTGQRIEFSKNSSVSRHGSASLDRIDSSKGYTVDNCVWVHKDINRLKNNYTLNQFVDMCVAVARHYAKEI